jgi:hypothetical protein
VGLQAKVPGVSDDAHVSPLQQCWVPPHVPFSVAHSQALAAAQNPLWPFENGTQHFVSQSALVVHGFRHPP